MLKWVSEQQLMQVDGSLAVVLLLLVHCLMLTQLFMGVLCFVFVCYALLCVFHSFAIILLRKRELVALLIGPDKDILWA